MAIRLLSGETIDGDASFSGRVIIGDDAITTDKPGLVVGDTTNGGQITIRGLSPTLFFDKTGANNPKILTDGALLQIKSGTLDSEGSVLMSLTGSAGNATFAGNVTVGNDGNINIPTASSGNANLNFDGSDFKITSNSSSANLKLETTSTTRLTIDSSGNVGINKTSALGSHGLSIKKVSNQQLGCYYNETNFAAFGARSNGDVQIYGYDGSSYKNILLGVDGSATGGNVGIGTTNPQENLHIKDPSDGVPVFRLEGGSRTYQQFVSGNDFFIRDVTASSNRIVLDNNGFVGIGTSSPECKLTVASSGSGGANPSTISSNTVATFRRTGGISHSANISILAGTSGLSNIFFGDRDDEDVGTILYDHSSNSMRFETNTSERMRIDSDGRVMINQTSNITSQALQVNGFIDITRSTSSAIRFIDNTTFRGGLGLDSWATGGSASNMTMFCEGEFGIVTGGGNTKKLVMDTSGNVGIGTTSPDQKLVVNQTATGRYAIKAEYNGTNLGGFFVDGSGNNELFMKASGNVEKVKIDTAGASHFSGGNVGIGLTGPAHLLHVQGDATDGVLVVSRTSNTDQKLFLRGGAGSGEGRVASNYHLELRSGLSGSNSYDLSLSTASGTALKVDATNNNIGIGNTNPTTKLTVQGVITAGDSTTNGVIRRQHQSFSTMKPGPPSGSSTDMIFVDHTHTLDITVMAYINTSNVATGRGYSVAAYGSATAGLTQTQFAGNISALSISYVNTGGSENYVLRVTTTYSGSTAPVISVSATGQSTSKLRAAT